LAVSGGSGFNVVEVAEAGADVPADHQDAVVGVVDDGGDGEFEVGSCGLSGGKAAWCGWVAPEDVAFGVGGGVDAADFAEGGDEAVAAGRDDFGSDAEEDVAGVGAVGHHWGDLEAAAVADGAGEHDAGALGNGDRVAVVAAEGDLVGAEMEIDVVGQAEDQSAGV
jgi:hypothetical protein